MEIVKNLPFADYIAKKDWTSNHQLNHLNECPATLLYFMEHEDKEATKELEIGRLFDIGVEDFDFFRKIASKDKRTKQTIKDDGDGGYLLGHELYDILMIMIENTLTHPDISKLLAKGDFQVSVFTELEEMKVKSRPDFLPELPVILDFKTTSKKPTDNNLRYEITKWRYFQQAAFYLDQLSERQAFNFVFVPKIPPYLPRVLEATPRMIEHGRSEYKRLLADLKQAQDSDIWPGYWGITPIDLPNCALKEG